VGLKTGGNAVNLPHCHLSSVMTQQASAAAAAGRPEDERGAWPRFLEGRFSKGATLWLFSLVRFFANAKK
jgi:hypothetical protein